MGLLDWFQWQKFENGYVSNYTEDAIRNLPANQATKDAIEYSIRVNQPDGQLPTAQDQSHTGGNWQATGSDACY